MKFAVGAGGVRTWYWPLAVTEPAVTLNVYVPALMLPQPGDVTFVTLVPLVCGASVIGPGVEIPKSAGRWCRVEQVLLVGTADGIVIPDLDRVALAVAGIAALRAVRDGYGGQVVAE